MRDTKKTRKEKKEKKTGCLKEEKD